MVEGGDRGGTQSFGGGDHRGVGGAEGQVAVAGDEFGDSEPVLGCDGFGDEVAGGEVAEESDLGLGSEAGAEEVGDFGDDQGGDDEGAGVGLEQLEAAVVVLVVAIDVGVEGAGVDDQADGETSPARISSMRSEMS